MIKKSLLNLLLLLTNTIVGTSIVIINARIEAPSIIMKALASDRMKLKGSEFSDEQLEALLKIPDHISITVKNSSNTAYLTRHQPEPYEKVIGRSDSLSFGMQ